MEVVVDLVGEDGRDDNKGPVDGTGADDAISLPLVQSTSPPPARNGDTVADDSESQWGGLNNVSRSILMTIYSI